MAAASQLACRAGPAIYITLAFHRSPLTRRCLGPRPGGPEVPGATRGLRQPMKPWAWGALGLGKGKTAACSGLGLRPPSCQPLMEEGGGHWGHSLLRGERAFKSARFPTLRAISRAWEEVCVCVCGGWGEPAAASTAGTRSCRSWAW